MPATGALGAGNHRVRRLGRLLASARARSTAGLIVVEGPVLAAEFLASGGSAHEAFVEEGYHPPVLADLVAAGVPVRRVAPGVLAGVLTTTTPQPLAVVGSAPAAPPLAPPGGRPLVVAVDLRDPGNAGTLLRTAEAAGAAGVVLAGGSVDPDGPKVVRASAGSRFRVAVWRRRDPGAALDELRRLGWPAAATVVDPTATPYDEVELSKLALVLGNEARGLDPEVAGRCDHRLTIPLDGPTESLNVATAGAVLCFEASRQRRRGANRLDTDPRTRTPLTTMPTPLDRLDDLRADALGQVAAAGSLDALRAVESRVLGRSAPLTSARRALGQVDPARRSDAGRALNQARQAVEAAIAARRDELAAAARRARLEAERLDLTEVPRQADVGHHHLVTQAWEELEDVFVGMGFRVAEGPEVETDWMNFDALNIPPGHPARDSFDTLYVDHGPPGSTLLRTHTSPVQIRTMLAQAPPIYVVAPGRVFRRDTADATHMPVFHQIEGLVVDRHISLADLAGTIEAFTTAYFGPGFTSRLRPSYFPFTEPSAEFDIRRPDGSWLELGGCGMVHPNVLRAGGIDPEAWSGFAFGFGIDRIALMKFGVDDLRELFSNDVRFLSQF
jgi:phenylalanyl-tRNA synthetase alpha chain